MLPSLLPVSVLGSLGLSNRGEIRRAEARSNFRIRLKRPALTRQGELWRTCIDGLKGRRSFGRINVPDYRDSNRPGRTEARGKKITPLST